MRKIITAVALILALTACDPKAGGGGGGKPPAGGGKPPAAGGGGVDVAVAHLAALGKDGREVHRVVNCAILGLNTHGDVVEIEENGKKSSFAYNVKDLTPFKIRLKSRGGVHMIKLNCVVQGQANETLHLEVTTADERRPAAMLDAHELGETGTGRRATVSATVLANV